MSVKKLFVSSAAFVALMITTTVAAQAATSGGVQRVAYPGETHTGFCCSVWNDAVQVTQPEKNVPMIVTFSTEYRSTAPMRVGLKLNNGPCTFYGPASLDTATPANYGYVSATLQWVILPGDYGLTRGTNTIQLCGGGTSLADSIEFGFYTVSVRLEK
jgi:hypothetical protein